MKTWKTLGSFCVKTLLSAAMLVPAVTSCYDDSKIWAEIEDINTKLDELTASLNGQIEALNALLAGGDITIAECTRNNDGTYQITLSNGTEFSVFPQDKTLTGLISCKEVNGVNYWAAYDETGALVPLKDASGKNIPVDAEKPVVEKRDDAYYLIIDGQEYITGYENEVTVITSYEINTDDSGNIYSVSFTFGDEAMTFTIPMASYKGLSYVLGNASAGGKVVKDLYVTPGETYQISLRLDGVVDYVLSTPAGWKVEEETDINETYLNITAPTSAEIEGGAAAYGDLKAVAVLEDGKAMIAKLALTTEPFKTLTATSTNAIVEKYNGVDKYIYGLVPFADYDEDALFADAAQALTSGEGFIENDVNQLLSEILGAEIVPGEAYVLWAIPAFYVQDEESAEYVLRDGVIAKYIFGGSAVTLDVEKVYFNNANISFEIAGADAYYAGTSVYSETVLDDVLYKINNQIISPVTTPLTYAGSAFSFPSAEANESVTPVSEQKYISWVVPVKEDGNYTADNVIYKEFTLNAVTSGGSTTVEVSQESSQVDRVSISVPVSSENASRLYYVFMKSSDASRYKNREETYLLKYGNVLDVASATLTVDSLEPDTKYSLFVMSTDPDGKYGEATVAEFTTNKLSYNNLQVSLEVTSASKSTASATVSVSGGDATEYVYWVGNVYDEFWVNAKGNTNAEKIASIQQTLALYPESMIKMLYTHPLENGVLSMSGLRGGTEHHIVMLAKDESGNYSVAGTVPFTTLKVNLGTVVVENSQQWKNAKAQIDIKWHENSFVAASNSGMFAYYSFEIKCPTEYTAYILSASDEYFSENPKINTIEDRMIEIENQCSDREEPGRVIFDQNGDYAQEPDWTDDNGDTHTGTLMNVYDFYLHGNPKSGAVTYFAAGSHGSDNCTAWENGACTNYESASQSIAKRLTLDYYKEYVKDNRASYCKLQSTIDKAAQDLYDAYYEYYKDAKPIIYENDGSYLNINVPYATGLNDEGEVVDDVFVMLKDSQGNYYEPMKYEVPNYFN